MISQSFNNDDTERLLDQKSSQWREEHSITLAPNEYCTAPTGITVFETLGRIRMAIGPSGQTELRRVAAVVPLNAYEARILSEILVGTKAQSGPNDAIHLVAEDSDRRTVGVFVWERVEDDVRMYTYASDFAHVDWFFGKVMSDKAFFDLGPEVAQRLSELLLEAIPEGVPA